MLERLRHRAAASLRFTVLTAIVLFSAMGYLFTSRTIHNDRRAAAVQRARADSVRSQVLLQSAEAYVVGLGELLANERRPGQQAFAFLTGTTSASSGLVDALWIPSRTGALVAKYATTVTPGLPVSRWPALLSLIRDQGTVFLVSATGLSTFGGQNGFFLLENAHFGGSSGYLAVFVPQGWVTLSLAEDPRQLMVTLGGERLEGQFRGPPAGVAGFSSLGQNWRIGVPLPSPTGLQSSLPWLALGWPPATAVLTLLIVSAIMRRRRAERAVERIFDLSVDLLCVYGYDGFFKRVNPAFERTLGYSSAELLAKPFFEFIHPLDREATREAVETLSRGERVVHFENRYIRKDQSVRWLEWSARPVLEERLMYGVGRDVTERRQLVRQLHDLVAEQAALRRVATLVARGVSAGEVFDAVTSEVRALLGAQAAGLLRFEPDGTAILLTMDAEPGAGLEVGTRLPLGDDSITDRVRRTGRAANVTDLADAPEGTGARLNQLGLRSVAGAPVVVEGGLWGSITAGWTLPQSFTSEIERRLTQFTELVATALANAHNRGELVASRTRLVQAADEARRRIERDLHDGAQQHLVSLVFALRGAQAEVPPGLDALRRELAEAEAGLTAALAELQELSRGIHPAILSKGGLALALNGLTRTAAVPVEMSVSAPQRLPQSVEVAAYYLVSEALTNASKHARASAVHVRVTAQDSLLEIVVDDDGVGGADPRRGSGLLGLRDRVEALGGTIEISSEPGRGTSVHARIPMPDREAALSPAENGAPIRAPRAVADGEC